MMEAYKRGLVRGWCQAVTAAAFVDTVNVNARPLPTAPIWFTVQWQAHAVAAIAYGGVTEETGQLGVIVAGEPNLGDLAVAEASDSIVAELLARMDPQGHLTLERAGATTEHSGGRWYRLFTPLDYRLISGALEQHPDLPISPPVIMAASGTDTTAGQAADREGDYKVIIRRFVLDRNRFTVTTHPDGFATVGGRGFLGVLGSRQARALGFATLEHILREIKDEKAREKQRKDNRKNAAKRSKVGKAELLARWRRDSDADPKLTFWKWADTQPDIKRSAIYEKIPPFERN